MASLHPNILQVPPGGGGGENVDPVVMVQIYTIPNAPTQPTILFDQSLDSEKTFTEITVTIAFPFSRI